MSKKLYTLLGQSEEPFVCLNCSLCAYRKEIKSLQSTIDTLTNELTSVKDELAKLQTLNTPNISVTVEPSSKPPDNNVKHLILLVMLTNQASAEIENTRANMTYSECYSLQN